MFKFYDFIIKFRWSGWGPTKVFLLGMQLRKLLFQCRETLGSLYYSPLEFPQKIDATTLKKILVIRTDRIGDIVLSIPALNGLRSTFSDAQIDIVVKTSYKELLKCYPVCDSVIPIDNVDNIVELRKLGRQLKKEKYDVTIVMHPASYAFSLAKMVKSPTIGWRAKGYGHTLSYGFPDDRAESQRHQVENNLKLMNPLGVISKYPQFNPIETELGIQQFTSFSKKYSTNDTKKMVVIHPGSHNPRVRWSATKFAEVADYLAKKGFEVVIIATPHDAGALEAMVQALHSRPIISTDDFNLQGLISLFKHSYMFIGQSTGPMHVAASTGCWTIAVFGNEYPLDHYSLWRPYGEKGIVCHSNVECCGMPWTCSDLRCIKSVEINDVTAAIDTIIGNSK